jgi:PAS domain S-box-containing protein
MKTDDGFRLLVIEDGPDAQENLRDILRMDGHHFDIVGTGGEALALCERSAYCAIILDWTLPDGTGEMLLPQLRLRCPQAAILVITGTVGLGGTLAAIRHEVVDYLVKPFDSGDLRKSLLRIVERWQLMVAKERSEAALRALLEAAPCAILIFRPDRTTAYFSPYATRLTGYAAEELLGKDYGPILVRDAESQQRIDSEAETVLAGGQTRGFEHPVWCKDGTRRWLVWNAERLDDYKGAAAVLAVGQDISARRVAEQRLLAEHSSARVLAEAADLAEAAPKLLRAVCASVGWDRGEWWEFDAAAGALRCRESWYSPSPEVEEFERFTRSRSLAPGSGLPGSVWRTGAPVWLDDLCDDALSIRLESSEPGGYRSAFAFPALFHQGPLGVLVFFSREAQSAEPELLSCMASLGSQIGQFVARKRAEQRALEAERLAAVGEVMNGLIHEGRNALQRGRACLEMLAIEVEGQTAAIGLIDRVQRAHDQLHRLYERVRDYAMPLKLDRELHQLDQILLDAWEGLSANHQGRDAHFHHEKGDLPLRSYVDRAKLLHVFHVILDNSLSATNGPVEIRAIWSQTLADGHPAFRVAINDDGPGVSSSARQKMFQPFNTTKTHGLGLGMAIAKRIVEAHDGTIALNDGHAPGAEFVVTLPRAAS